LIKFDKSIRSVKNKKTYQTKRDRILNLTRQLAGFAVNALAPVALRHHLSMGLPLQKYFSFMWS